MRGAIVGPIHHLAARDVKDKQSGAVPEAVIELLRTDTGLRRNVTTGASGEYQFSQVPPGNYTITATKPGFTVLTQKDVELQINTPATLNLTLEVASVTESVNVEAEAPTINTTDAAMGNAFHANAGPATARCRPAMSSNF